MKPTFKVGLIVLVGLLVIGTPAMTQNAGDAINGDTSGWIIKILTFIQTIAEYIGKGLVGLVDQIANVELEGLQEPLGYLGVLTLFLGALTMISAAKKVLWFIVMMGWGLVVIRIVLEILNKSNVT